MQSWNYLSILNARIIKGLFSSLKGTSRVEKCDFILSYFLKTTGQKMGVDKWMCARRLHNQAAFFQRFDITSLQVKLNQDLRCVSLYLRPIINISESLPPSSPLCLLLSFSFYKSLIYCFICSTNSLLVSFFPQLHHSLYLSPSKSLASSFLFADLYLPLSLSFSYTLSLFLFLCQFVSIFSSLTLPISYSSVSFKTVGNLFSTTLSFSVFISHTFSQLYLPTSLSLFPTHSSFLTYSPLWYLTHTYDDLSQRGSRRTSKISHFLPPILFCRIVWTRDKLGQFGF